MVWTALIVTVMFGAGLLDENAQAGRLMPASSPIATSPLPAALILSSNGPQDFAIERFDPLDHMPPDFQVLWVAAHPAPVLDSSRVWPS